MKDYVSWIQEQGITGEIIADMIENDKANSDRRLQQYLRYRGDSLPIMEPRVNTTADSFESPRIKRLDKCVNNILAHPFDRKIINTKVGYLFGLPINYDVDEREVNVELSELVEKFVVMNNTADKDAELGKKAGISGVAARLLYIDKDGQERMMNINPWEVIVLSENGDLAEPTYSLRYFERETKDGRENVAMFYDENNIYEFVNSSKTNGYQLKDSPKIHLFEGTPLFFMPNDEEMKGDAEVVYSLIDAYNRVMSDASNEIEQYRLAYLVLKGLRLREDDLQKINQNGVFEMMKDDTVEYLTKDINDSFIENHLNRLREDILTLAESVDFTNGSFGGQISGVALQAKLRDLEMKSLITERKMSAALRYQFKLLCSSWARRYSGVNREDYLAIFFSFKRNSPIDLLTEAQTAQALMTITSEETALGTLSVVDDVKYEQDKKREEALDVNNYYNITQNMASDGSEFNV